MRKVGMFPLKPFLFLCLRSPDNLEQSALVDYNAGVKALYSYLGPISYSGNETPIPKGLENWTCREIASIIKVPESIIFWTIIELDQ